jgi:hypothetical protein
MYVRIYRYDMGGGTFDVTLLEIEEGVFEVRPQLLCLPPRRAARPRRTGCVCDGGLEGRETVRGVSQS